MDYEELRTRFTFHPATEDKALTYEQVRLKALEYATWLNLVLPEGREKSLALTKLDEVVFWSNASIARDKGLT